MTKQNYNLFYAFKASIGLIRLILLAIMELDNSPIDNAKTSIGRREKALKEKLNPSDKLLPISMFATNEITTSSNEAITNEIKHYINEWK